MAHVSYVHVSDVCQLCMMYDACRHILVQRDHIWPDIWLLIIIIYYQFDKRNWLVQYDIVSEWHKMFSDYFFSLLYIWLSSHNYIQLSSWQKMNVNDIGCCQQGIVFDVMTQWRHQIVTKRDDIIIATTWNGFTGLVPLCSYISNLLLGTMRVPNNSGSCIMIVFSYWI